jgi:hypothetical protein
MVMLLVSGYVTHFRLAMIGGVGRNRRKNGPAKAAKGAKRVKQRVRIDGDDMVVSYGGSSDWKLE